jgi:glycosyltransferase involved in cell wall biosynthesis
MTSSKETHASAGQRPRILYIDLAYTLEMVKGRQLDQEFAARTCGGYFEHVWGVHPLADIPGKKPLDYEGFRPVIVEVAEDQTIIEGVSAYFSVLRSAYTLNFLASQAWFTAYLIRLVKRERITVIMSTDPYFAGLIGAMVRLATGVPLAIWVIANYDEIHAATGQPAYPRMFKRRWVEKIAERFVLRLADLVVGGNQNNLEFALKNGAKESRSTVFPSSKLLHRRHATEPASRAKDELVAANPAVRHFIYVGRLLDVKHPDDVLRAFSVIAGAEPGCALLMAGDGPMRGELEELARELKIEDRVQFMGNVAQERLANLLAGCFAVLSPLTGRALVECALAGLPIVAYDRDWQGSFVGPAGAGIIVPFRDWKRMGEAALELVHDPEKARRMGEAARRKGLDVTDLEKLFAHEREEFEKLRMRQQR